jgi:hypothetical protein
VKLPELRQLIQEELRKVREGSASKLYKIEGYLVTSTDKKTQSQILSDIRSVPGVTTVDVEEYIPRLPKKGREYDRLTIKVDPFPYIKNGDQFTIDTINQVISSINSIKGVIKFKVKDPQLINIGI